VGGHIYKISIPEYMVKTYELNDVASIQYQDTTKEAYIIVIEDAKDQLESLGIKFTDAKNFLDEFVVDYKIENEKRSLKNASEFKANGNACAQVELYWTEEETNFFMLITIVESKTHFYKILNWTISENAPNLKNDFIAISKSLKD
jgi:UDP:flavonoid glycosyltransferase YjiC (YdhE family)